MKEKQQPYISFILPIYNVSEYLPECIESIINQERNFEIEVLLIDDGSKDNSWEICRKYSEKYPCIKSFHKENGGLSDARNFGLVKAIGKYIIFVDSDDLISEKSIQKIVDECKSQNEPDVFFLHVNKYYEDARLEKYDDLMDSSILNKNRETALRYLYKREKYPASAWSKMVLRDLLISKSIQFIKGQLSEDYIWTLKLLKNAKTFGASNNEYYFYRQNREGSITKQLGEKHFTDLLDIIDYFILESRKIDNEFIFNRFALKSASYIYCIVIYNSQKFYEKYKTRINQNKYLLKYTKGLKFKIIGLLSALIGIRNVTLLIGVYKKRGLKK